VGIARDAIRFGSVYGAGTDGGHVHGVAIWLPPIDRAPRVAT
jgi:hypothetical protein